jgi:methylmalonyl-CoA mutase C-terminal domain/subunit
MGEAKRIRVLMAKPGFDGHWRGAMVVSMALRDAGMEVIFTGNQSPQEIVEAALQEDVDVIGLSILVASHLRLLPEVPRLLREKGAQDILVVVGGTIPREDIPRLKEAGIDEVFIPGTRLDTIVEYIQQHAGKKAAEKNPGGI